MSSKDKHDETILTAGKPSTGVTRRSLVGAALATGAGLALSSISATAKTFESSTHTAKGASSSPIKTIGYAAMDAKTPLRQMNIERRAPGLKDIEAEILYCGVCHSDLHLVRNEWGWSTFPMVAGHEIIGRVVKVGAHVSKFKVGDYVGYGCIADSCGHCSSCQKGEEHHCEDGAGYTSQWQGNYRGTGEKIYGGFSKIIVLGEDYTLKIPDGMDLKSAAPILCAGITTYSPLRHWKIGIGHKVGVVGIGGLGHMGVKFAKALGAEVTAFTTTPWKLDDAKRLGATDAVLWSDKVALAKKANSLDFILDTIPEDHDINGLLATLRAYGTLCGPGNILNYSNVSNTQLVIKRRSLAGSQIGGIAEHQEVLDFCAKHKIGADVQVIAPNEIETAFDRMMKREIKYRSVVDMSLWKA